MQVPSSEKRRLLFAEDDEWVREETVLVLEELGFHVVAVTDGEKALAAFTAARLEGAGFEVAVLDVRMPRLHGTEITPRMLADDPELVIILSSGYERDHLDAAIFASGRVGFVAKPAAVGHFREALDALEAQRTRRRGG